MILLKLHFYEARAIFKCQILVNLNILKEATSFITKGNSLGLYYTNEIEV